MIDSWDELHKRSIEPIPGSPHFRWVPYQELLTECETEFRRMVEETHALYRSLFREETMAYQRRYILVVRRKYRARRRRRRR